MEWQSEGILSNDQSYVPRDLTKISGIVFSCGCEHHLGDARETSMSPKGQESVNIDRSIKADGKEYKGFC